jgi:hypothetical protein
MLTKVVEKQSPGSLSQHLGDMMPGLLKAYDNVESSVRKAAVFCIVALHQLVGEATLQVRDSYTLFSGSTCFWASRIRISLIIRSSSKNSKKNLDSYCFVNSFGLFIFEKCEKLSK